MDRLTTDQQLGANDELVSQSNLYTAIYQGDGNFVVYDNAQNVAWASGTDGSSIGRVVMQDDGNCVMYDGGGAAVWSTGTDGNPGASIVMQDDGNLVVYATDGSPLWASQDQDSGGGLFGAITHAVGAAVGAVVGVVQTVVNAAVDTVESVASPILNLAGAVVGFIEAIPVFGRLFGAVWDYATDLLNRVLSLPEVLFVLVGWMPEKRLRIMVIVQQDRGQPVADLARVRAYVQAMIDVYRRECNVRVLPALPFRYSSPLQGTPQATDAYFALAPFNSDASLLTVGCGSGLTDDLGITSGSGPAFQTLLNVSSAFWGSFRRVVGIGAPITTFAVQQFTDGKDGCSDYVGVDYVLVAFKPKERSFPDLGRMLTLAHENGHACGLLHTDDTVMKGGYENRPATFNKVQKLVIRTSRHVSYV